MTVGHLLLGNGTVNMPRQQYRLFSMGSVQSGYMEVSGSTKQEQ
jgi:hypothetical protein